MSDTADRLFRDVRPLPPPGLKLPPPPGLKPLVMTPLKPLGVPATSEARRPVGRPSSYSPELCAEAADLAKQGKTKAQIACYFDVSRQTLDNWCKDHPEFLDSLKGARNYLTLLKQSGGRP